MFIVICLDDYGLDDEPTYVQATRRKFESREDATAYAETVAKTRFPLVVTLDD
jgi:hypothetical protein